MIIGQYIKQLLEEGKRVILPGFGNLQLVDRGEGVPPSGGHMAPPGRTVRFDAGYSKDDGLLAAVAAEGEQIDPEEARQRVLELIDAIRFSLDKGEPYSLADAGTFTRDEDGRIRFMSDPEWILEPDQYGLESMDLLELEEEQMEEEPLPGYEAGPTATVEPTTTVEPAGSVEPGTGIPAGQPEALREGPSRRSFREQPLTELATPEKEKRRASPWRVIWIIATALIVILVALIILPEDLFRGGRDLPVVGEPGRIYQQGDRDRVPGAGEPEGGEAGAEAAGPGEGAEGAGEAAEGQGAGMEEPAGVAQEDDRPGTEEDSPGQSAGEDARYFVIAGSFGNLANASELQDKLSARGFPSDVMVTSNRLYRVSVASYVSREDALKGLERIKSTPGLESAWLLAK